MGSAEEIYASAASGGHFVVVGDNFNADAVIWESGNGRDWTTAELPSLPGYIELKDVAAMGNGFVAVGTQYDSGEPTGFVATSDDGRTWQINAASRVDGWQYEKVGVVDSTIVVSAEDFNFTRTEFLVSTDGGATWGPLGDPNDVAKNGLLDLVTTDTQFWAFGPESSAKQAQVEIWTSTDGQTWTTAGTLPNSAGAGSTLELIATQGPRGWVVLAHANEHNKPVDFGWWSADGTSWQSAQNPPFAFDDVFADASGFVVVGKWLPQPAGCALDPADYQGASWTSTDGLLWTRMPDDGWKSQWIEQLRRFNRTLIGIGIDYTGSNDQGVGAIWTAKLPDVATNAGPGPSDPPIPENTGCGG
jgi:hypothetical protein